MTDLQYNFIPAPMQPPFQATKFVGDSEGHSQSLLKLGDLSFTETSFSLFTTLPQAPSEIGISNIYALPWAQFFDIESRAETLLSVLQSFATCHLSSSVHEPRRSTIGSMNLAGLRAPFVGLEVLSQRSSISTSAPDIVYLKTDHLAGSEFSINDFLPYKLVPVLNNLVAAAFRQPNILAFSLDNGDLHERFKLERKLWYVVLTDILDLKLENLYAYQLLQSIFKLSINPPTKIASIAIENHHENTTGVLCMSEISA